MRIMYRLNGVLYVGNFDEVYFDELYSLLIASSCSCDLKFEIPLASAVLAMSKLLADGYCDLQSFDCGYF